MEKLYFTRDTTGGEEDFARDATGEEDDFYDISQREEVKR